jgi:hypothetical protein
VLPSHHNHCRKSVPGWWVNGAAACWLVLDSLLLGVGPIACKKTVPPSPLAPRNRGPIHDLAAVRAGNELSLNWSMPSKSARRLAVNGSITVRICRRETPSGVCSEVGQPLLLAPGSIGDFSEQLPETLVSGPPRLLYYFVELLDREGHSTGLSNTVATLAGAPLPAIRGLTAEIAGGGILLRWPPIPAAEEPAGTFLRLRRTLLTLTPPAPDALSGSRQSGADPFAGDRVIEVAPGLDHTLDTRIRSGDTYEYSAQRVVQARVGHQMLELAGQLSVPIQVNVPR